MSLKNYKIIITGLPLVFTKVFQVFKSTHVGSGLEWHSDKMTRSSNRHGASLWHGGSLWHSDKLTPCVNLAQRQNDMVVSLERCVTFAPRVALARR